MVGEGRKQAVRTGRNGVVGKGRKDVDVVLPLTAQLLEVGAVRFPILLIVYLLYYVLLLCTTT